MGNPFLLQACLRLDLKEIPNQLVLGKKYKFKKEGHRLYQIKVPMDLRTTNWKFIARVVVIEYTLGNDKTEGTFVPVKLFSEKDRETITQTYVSDEEVEKVLKNVGR